MEFSVDVVDQRPIFDLHQLIYASGEITPGTTDRFEQFVQENRLIDTARVYLDTLGGSLREGMCLGRKISELKFRTDVGRKSEKKIFGVSEVTGGICASAGVLAYLGGLFRYMRPDSKLGVHQFFATKYDETPQHYMSLAQSLSGEIIEYLLECRAAPQFFGLMASTPPEKISFVDHQRLREFRVITDHIFLETWELQLVSGVPYLRGHVIDERGEHKLIFLGTPSGEVIATAFWGTHYKEDAVREAATLGFFIDDNLITVPSTALGVPPHVSGDFVCWLWTMPWDLMVGGEKAERIGAALQSTNKDIYMGFHIRTLFGKRELTQFLDWCRDKRALLGGHPARA